MMQVAYERRAAVVPWGGGTQQNIGNPPARVDLLVRTERLNRVLIHEPDDLTISVEAGITLGALRELTARHGQMLPLDPPLAGRATIGGLLATAADGPRRLGYGTLRELTIGIAVVEASGRISRGGGMVVKNVSGFDMMKLYLGSLGTLAIIASANFKLLPIPRAAATLLCTFDDPAAAFAAIEAIQLTQLTPTAAEYLNSAALKALDRSGSCALALRAEGLPQAVERHIAELTMLTTRNGATDTRRLDQRRRRRTVGADRRSAAGGRASPRRSAAQADHAAIRDRADSRADRAAGRARRRTGDDQCPRAERRDLHPAAAGHHRIAERAAGRAARNTVGRHRAGRRSALGRAAAGPGADAADQGRVRPGRDAEPGAVCGGDLKRSPSAIGRLKLNVLPWPSTLSNHSCPPCSATSILVIAKLSPP